MTYRIEIKAETLAELAGKAYAFAVGVQSASRAEWSPIKAEADIELEVAEAAPENPTPAPKSAPSVETSENQPTTEEPSTTPAPTAEDPASSGQTEAPQPTEEKASASSPTEASDTPSELNFDTDVAPIVLQVVKEKGKPVVQEILEQFGVERASQLDPARWPELVAKLGDAI